jgi:hypothetical protein
VIKTEANPGKFPDVVDSTIRASWKSCPTKFYWEFCRQIAPKGGSVDLIAGGAFAKGLEVVRKSFHKEKRSYPESLHEGMKAAIAEWGDFECPEHKQQKNISRVIQALEFYFFKWPIESDPVQPYFWAEGEPAVEFTFSIPLPILHPQTGNPIIYGGRLDMIGVFNDQIFLVDEKTASQLGPTWGSKWNLRGQFTGYAWAAKQTGLPVAGAIVRGISFLKTGFGAAESLQFRADWQLESWYEQLLTDVEAMVSDWNRRQFSQSFADSCESYSGCPFMQLCEAKDPEVWTPNYAPRVWNPLDRYPPGKPKQEEGEIVPLGFSIKG